MSFFSDFVAGAATSASGEITRRQAEQAKIDDEQRQQQLAIERERAVAKMKADMAAQETQAKRTRTNEQMNVIEAAAPEVTRARQLAEMQARAPSATGDTMDIVRQRLSPAEMQKYYGVEDNVVSRMGDKLGIARKNGFFEAEDQLAAAYKETVAQVKADLEEKKFNETVRNNDLKDNRAIDREARNEARDEARHKEAMASINARGARGEGSADEVKLINAYSSLTGRMTQRLAEIREANPAAMGAKLTAIVDSDPELMELKSVMADVKSRLPGAKVQPGAPTPAPTAAPAPAGKTSAPMRQGNDGPWNKYKK